MMTDAKKFYETSLKSKNPAVQLIAMIKNSGYNPALEIVGRKEVNDLQDRIKKSPTEIFIWRGDFSVIKEIESGITNYLSNSDNNLKILMDINRFSLLNASRLLKLQCKFPNLEFRHFETKFRGEIYGNSEARILVKSSRYKVERMGDGKPGPEIDYYKVWVIDLAKWIIFLRDLWRCCWDDADPNVKEIIHEYSN
jgi:hypothetical protein